MDWFHSGSHGLDSPCGMRKEVLLAKSVAIHSYRTLTSPRLPRHEGSVQSATAHLAHDKRDDVCDVFRRAKSLERRGLRAHLAGTWDRPGIMSVKCIAWRDRVHGDPPWRKFMCEAFRELLQSPLAAEVCGRAGQPDMGAVRGNVHETTAFHDDLRRFL